MPGFSYADAVKLLGAKESKLVSAIDKLLSGVLLGGSVLGLPQLLGWFDAKSDFIRLSHELVTKVSDRKYSRYDRTQRLHAAHTVLAVVALFEVFDELDTRVKLKDLDRQTEWDYAHLLTSPVPLPSPDQPYETHLVHLELWYRPLAGVLIETAQHLAVWDKLNETEQDRFRETMRRDLVDQALQRYEELFRRLAGDFPEVAFWWTLQEGRATRTQIGTALTRLETTLRSIAVGESPDVRRAELARKYRAVLNHPIIESDDAPEGLSIPMLGECYIDPLFQVCDAGLRYSQRSWWDDRPVRDDMYKFLAGYLTSPFAVLAPLLVLGDPGSGKSVLTKVLAAQLPASDFMVLRVELRSVPTEADILGQIEHGLRAALQEDVSWAALTRSAGEALPVVLLDGFDELLQATGVSQTDYLKKIARFQRDSVDTGRPVAFVVTSRISVAGRAQLPNNSVVLRMVPFVENQIARWLDVWNKSNTPHLKANGLDPLTAEVAWRYRDLAEQPLLLLMLALYDAHGNALQRIDVIKGQAELYDGLLTLFARREVVKDGVHRSETELAEAVEDELERLSIVAFAMFNRGAQWVAERDLDADLVALLGDRTTADGSRAPLGAAEKAIGRFYFVQRAQANREDRTLRTYEFLHATFGEFLVARSTWRVLLDLVERNRPRRKFAGALDDSELYALLSFEVLCEREPVLAYLDQIADDTHRQQVVDLLVQLFRVVGEPHPNRRLADYEPVRLSVPARYAAYSVNLVLLAAVIGEKVTGSALFGEDADVRRAWRSYALLWHSQLTSSNWTSLLAALRLHRVWRGKARDLEIEWTAGLIYERAPFQPDWMIGSADMERIHIDDAYDRLRDSHYFTCGVQNELLLHFISPLVRGAPRAARYLDKLPSGEWISGIEGFAPEFFNNPRNPDRLREYLHAAGNGELVSTREFWILVCEQIGKGSGYEEWLFALLCRDLHLPRASGVIPEHLLDAWLRVLEGGSELPRFAPSLAELGDSIDLAQLERDRPDLITRLRRYVEF